jgi:hypothetical protein
MSLRAPHRVSLVLPVGSGRAILAAIQVVFHLLRTMRVELDLLREPGTADTASSPQPGAPGAILFVAALSQLSNVGRETQPPSDQALRSYIERSYARQGIARVEYELEIL